MNTFRYYDTCTNSWTELPDINFKSPGGGGYSSHSTVAVNGDIYSTGGISIQNTSENGGYPVNFHLKYDTATQTWTNLTSTAPFPRAAYHSR
jgi:N-acetylneuraminic acid mutarotase